MRSLDWATSTTTGVEVYKLGTATIAKRLECPRSGHRRQIVADTNLIANHVR
ncbi:MAG TPA: hypothetical protein VHC71_15355 [Hyphomicrobium sp.]|jgi:hypothetical protein|nr:hypothetical protein [Hyphomicrobium sp.]